MAEPTHGWRVVCYRDLRVATAAMADSTGDDRSRTPGPGGGRDRAPANSGRHSPVPGSAADDAGAAPPPVTVGAALPALRMLYRRKRLGAARPPARDRETRMRVLGQLPAFAIIAVGAIVAVGAATEQFGPAGTARVAALPTGGPPAAAHIAVARAAAFEPRLTPLASRGADAAPSVIASRCDALAAHPDDPGKPRGTAGVAFDAMTEAATREALAACAAALREDSGNLRARFNLGRAYQRMARLKPAESGEAWRRAGEAYAEAARRGYAAAQGNLGQMIYAGAGGFAPDRRAAIEWLRKAAAGDYPDAYLTLAHAYSKGRGIAADRRKSFCFLTLFERAATVPAHRALARQQRAAIAIGPAEKRAIEDAAAKGASCL